MDQMVSRGRPVAERAIVIQLGAGSSRAGAALRDLMLGLDNWRLWTLLAWMDVKQRYRRAVLGPFWITISMSVLVVALGILYAGIFRQDIRSFLPYIGAGFIVWHLFSTTISESATAFTQAEGLIKQGGIPLSLHVFRSIFRNLLIGAHNFTVMLLLYLWQPSLLSWNLFLLIPGLVLFVVNLAWISMILGILCTRYRDLPPIVANLLQIMFFISPIMYRPDALPRDLVFFVHLNPIYYFIEIVRAPLLGIAPVMGAYVILTVMAVAGLLAAFLLFTRARRRIPYWV